MTTSDAERRWREPAGIELADVATSAGPLRLRALGVGPKVAVLHGPLGSSRLMMPVMQVLAASGYSVLAPDWPGHGRSLAQATDVKTAAGLLAHALADHGVLAMIAAPNASAMMAAVAEVAPACVPVAVLAGTDPDPPSFGLSEDGGHLNQLWTFAVTAAEGDAVWAQRVVAEAALATASGRELAQATAQASTGLVDRWPRLNLDQAPDLIDPAMAGQATLTRGFRLGPFGRLHVLQATPWAASTKPPLLCLHASPLSGKIYRPLARALGGTRRVFAPDTPGFGDSDAPPKPAEIGDFVDAIMAVLNDDLGDTFDLFGFHTGSMIAAEIAARYPQRARRIVMISAPLFTPEELAWFRDHYLPKPEAPDGSHNVERWQAFWSWRGPRQDIDHYARNHAEGMRGGPMYFWGHRAAFNHDFAGRLTGLDQPTLVLNPGDDLVEQTRRAQGLMRHGLIRELPQCGHGMLESDTDMVAGEVTGFLDNP